MDGDVLLGARPAIPDAATGQPLTVSDLLELPVMKRGRPAVLAGRDLDRRAVRWVHTSEIYEISPLLKGGEVLLTTGLGLVGADPEAVYEYGTALADRSIAALVLELGRTFSTAPEALVTSAARTGMPLISMNGIVPFIDITESVHALLLSHEVGRLRLVQRIMSTASSLVLSGAGLVAILQGLAELAQCPVRLYASDGHLVSASDGRSATSSEASSAADDTPSDGGRPPQSTGTFTGACRAPVDVDSHLWGYLTIDGRPTAARALIAEHGATAVALELGRTGTHHLRSNHRRAGALLVRDIFGRQYASVDEITGRAAALGLVNPPDHTLVGICAAVDRTVTGTSTGPRAGSMPSAAQGSRQRATALPTSGDTATVIAGAAHEVFGAAPVADLDGSYLIAASVAHGDMRSVLRTLADRIDRRLPSGRCHAVTSGPPATDFGSLGHSLRIARETSVLARRLHSAMRTLLYTDLSVHRLLGRFATDPELATFVDQQLGPLLNYDAKHGRDLVRTLETLLASGLSKAAAARSLHIRRQTLYQRLDTISSLLGGLNLDIRERRTAIDLALVGWRLRSAGVSPSATHQQ